MDNRKFDKSIYEHHNIFKKNEGMYHNLAVRFGLSECAFWILYVLRSNYALLTQRDLCDWLYQPKQSIHTALRKLQEKEYIELSFGDNKRSKYISLTDEGKRFCESTVDRVIEAEQKALTGLSDSEQETLFQLFHRYTDLLEERFGLIE